MYQMMWSLSKLCVDIRIQIGLKFRIRILIHCNWIHNLLGILYLICCMCNVYVCREGRSSLCRSTSTATWWRGPTAPGSGSTPRYLCYYTVYYIIDTSHPKRFPNPGLSQYFFNWVHKYVLTVIKTQIFLLICCTVECK